MTHVSHRSGSEGPRHDPYHYDEYTLNRPNGDTIVIHSGLANWCKLKRDNKIVLEAECTHALPEKLFETYAGVSFRKFEKAFNSIPERKLRTHFCFGLNRSYKDFKCVSGYPGETLLVCSHCNDVIDSSFDRSAIE
jgi:hypothetical protein